MDLKKVLIGLLIGTLLFCLCNKMFLVEGVEAGLVNNCRAKAKNPDTCTAENRCFDTTNLVCNGVGSDLLADEELARQKCEEVPGYEWCEMGDTPPTPPTPPSPQAECQEKHEHDEAFPSYDSEKTKLHIQVYNSSEGKIRVWLDDLPFCPKMIGTDSKVDEEVKFNCGAYTQVDNPSTGKKGNNWQKLFEWFKENPEIEEDLKPKFYLIDSNREQTDISNQIKTNYYDLEAGEIFKITPPHALEGDHLLPQMCFYQAEAPSDQQIGESITTQNGDKFQYNCGGAGIYFTEAPENPDKYDNIVVGPDAISRIEYNINGGAIYFNLSGVDGINARYSIDIQNRLCCNGDGLYSQCNIDLDSCYDKTVLKDIEDKGDISNNYLAFANGDPDIKSCPSPKFYYGFETMERDGNEDPFDFMHQNLLGYGDITYDKLSTGLAEKEISQCNNVLDSPSWNENLKKVIIFSDTAIPSGEQVTDAAATEILQMIPGQHKVTLSHIKNYVYLLRDHPTTNENFGGGGAETPFYAEISTVEDQKSFTNKTLAECPWGTQKEKALCHLWWGSIDNDCATNWKKYLYETPEKGEKNYDSKTCNQYSWAYGEMGFDYTERDERGRPVAPGSGSTNNTIDGMADKNGGYLLFFKGNPQVDFPTGMTGPTWDWPHNAPGDEGNNLQSFNRPLLNCPLVGAGENTNYLANNPIYINIDIKQLISGKYKLSKNQEEKCAKSRASDNRDCGSVRKRNNPLPPGTQYTYDRMSKPFCADDEDALRICPGMNDKDQKMLDEGGMTKGVCEYYEGCSFKEALKDNFCVVDMKKDKPLCSGSNKVDCFKDRFLTSTPFYCPEK